MTFIRKWLCTAALSLGLITAATSAQASTFHIDFFEDGDTIPDWFGTFEAPAAGGTVTSFSALISGTTYSNPFLIVPTYTPTSQISGIFTNVPIPPAPIAAGLSVDVFDLWAFVLCGDSDCGLREVIPQGTYTITPSAVPLPPALPLFVSGLIVLGLAAKKRMRRN